MSAYVNESFLAGVAKGEDALRELFSGEVVSLLKSGEAADARGEDSRLKLDLEVEVVVVVAEVLLIVLLNGEDSRLKLLAVRRAELLLPSLGEEEPPSLGEDSRLKLLLESRRREPRN